MNFMRTCLRISGSMSDMRSEAKYKSVGYSTSKCSALAGKPKRAKKKGKRCSRKLLFSMYYHHGNAMGGDGDDGDDGESTTDSSDG